MNALLKVFALMVTLVSLSGGAWAGVSMGGTAEDEGGRGIYSSHFNQEDLEKQF